jgi:AraC-like DNA-binding protein
VPGPAGPVTEKVKALIIALLPTGAGYIEKVADQLSMTPRTLERRLKDEKTNFTILLQEVRKQLASNYIKQNTLELNEIAFLLGFSEFPAFSRAFRRWTGFLPKNFQREKQIR